ncbi:MAG: aspartate aminotransferase family protein [Cardiobacteriaceae bacterium]|nr:aspartate aminotransferase family protein [Cardiobacteriaceae bacterium]
MKNNEIEQLDHQYLLQNYARFGITLIQGEGCEVTDIDGKRYLDLTSGIGTNIFGWGDKLWSEVVSKQASTLQHVSNLFYSLPATQLAEKLVNLSHLSCAFFCNSGAEANEGTIKAARKYSFDKYGEGRHTILTLENSFHGRTLSTLAATGQDKFHQYFHPFTQGFEYLPINDTVALAQYAKRNDICAIMIEIVQGEGGICTLHADYLSALQQLCKDQDILLIIDEVQTGIGRTGKIFSYQYFNLSPDIVTLAKGLGGGLPIGAVLFGEKCRSVLGKGDHGSTFGGNPVCCAAANIVIDRLTPDFLAEVSRKAAVLKTALTQLPLVKEVTGLGLMLGIEFEEGIKAIDVVERCMQQGLLTLTAKEKLRLLPPLIISDEQIHHAIQILKQVLQTFKHE